MSRTAEPVPTPSVVSGVAAVRPVTALRVDELRDLGVADRPLPFGRVAQWSLRYNYGGAWRD